MAVLSNVTINYANKQDDSRQENASRKRKWRRSLGKRGDDHNPEGMLCLNSVHI